MAPVMPAKVSVPMLGEIGHRGVIAALLSATVAITSGPVHCSARVEQMLCAVSAAASIWPSAAKAMKARSTISGLSQSAAAAHRGRTATASSVRRSHSACWPARKAPVALSGAGSSQAAAAGRWRRKSEGRKP